MVKKLKNKNVMFCMDEVDLNGKIIDKKLYGDNVNEANRHIEIMYRPYRRDHANLTSTKHWLGAPELVLIYNQETPDLNYWDERAVKKTAKIMTYQWSPEIPTYLSATIQHNKIEDNNHMIQIAGSTDVQNYFQF